MGQREVSRPLDGNVATIDQHDHNSVLFTAQWTETFYCNHYQKSYTGTFSEVAEVLSANGFTL